MAIRTAIEKSRRLAPLVSRRRGTPGGRWPAELRERLAAALAERLPRGDTLTAIARDHGVSLGALSKLARANGHRLLTGRAAGRRSADA